MMQQTLPFHHVARFPLPQDNVAIATRTLAAGTIIELDSTHLTLSHTVLVGHRFATQPIAQGQGLYSWGLPFGVATTAIGPGDALANAGMIEALDGRSFNPNLGYTFPQKPNFQDRIVPYEVDEATFEPGTQVIPYQETRTFMGYRRSVSRGVGTRNMVVVLGTTSSTASYARALAETMSTVVNGLPNVDGIVPISHTEGSGYERINNRDFLLRTLAGLMVHPNVGAILAVDLASDSINNESLQTYLRSHNYPLDEVLHGFLTLSGQWEDDLRQGREMVEAWLPQVRTMKRTPESLSHLAIALQCGGSDAFSGISGNPLASSVTKEIIRHGGRANLAETDELIGSEAYVLQNVCDLDTARTFLNFIAEFKERLSWHGQSAEGNPSGGNKMRGLYNIALKSIGAAMKRHPDVRLDSVIDYGQPMSEPGYYFMNSPGNDLESIAGQVASGSNLIIFITGNGSITNFPFVPTIKVMTTTQRYELLADEMDVNAGAYLDGTSMSELTQETLELLIDIASGQPSKGELAGHAQISIWRNWQQQDRSRFQEIVDRPRPTGQAIPLVRSLGDNEARQTGANGHTNGHFVTRPTDEKVGLILPTSLCSGQIAQMAAHHLNENLGKQQTSPFSRFATLVHTEGCGVAFASTREIYAETMVGYATHPLVGGCLFLEHGCEKAHNDYLHSLLQERDLSSDDFGWASVQLDGGIEKVMAKIASYFQLERCGDKGTPVTMQAPPMQVPSIAILPEGEISPQLVGALAQFVEELVYAGGTVVMPYPNPLLQKAEFSIILPPSHLSTPSLIPSLTYGQVVDNPGFHLMEMPTPHWTEAVTGLGATGIDLILGFTDKPRPGHPLVPVLLANDGHTSGEWDLVLDDEPSRWFQQLVEMVNQVVSGKQQPKALMQKNIDFQLTRGWLGIST
ncbi:MAG: UxaA family hydrolase [Chloroflexota bacterium]